MSCEQGGAPISDRTLDQLRTTAAVLASIPNVSARIRTAAGVVVEVRRPPFPELTHSAMAVCTFRRAVVKAAQLRREGKIIAMLGLSGDEQPRIDIGSTVAGTVLPGRNPPHRGRGSLEARHRRPNRGGTGLRGAGRPGVVQRADAPGRRRAGGIGAPGAHERR